MVCLLRFNALITQPLIIKFCVRFQGSRKGHRLLEINIIITVFHSAAWIKPQGTASKTINCKTDIRSRSRLLRQSFNCEASKLIPGTLEFSLTWVIPGASLVMLSLFIDPAIDHWWNRTVMSYLIFYCGYVFVVCTFVTCKLNLNWFCDESTRYFVDP